MTNVTTSQGELHVPQILVVRASDRLWPWPAERRAAKIRKAQARLDGKKPRLSDAAIVAAARGLVINRLKA